VGSQETPLSTNTPLPAPHSVLGLVAALVDASLLQRAEGDDGEVRFRLLETVHQFAIQRLVAAGEADTVFLRLASWYRDRVVQAEPAMQGSEQPRWFAFFAAEHDNLRAAIAWALEREQTELALRLVAGPLWFFWSMRGWVRDERQWLERALSLAARPEARVNPLLLARALVSDGLYFFQTGDYERARDRFTTALAQFRALGDPGRAGVAAVLGNLGMLDNDEGRYDQARTRFEEALAIRRVLGDPLPTARTLVNLGNVANLLDDHETATRLLDEALPILQGAGERRTMAYCLNNLGESAAGRGHDGRATAYFDQAIALLRQTGDVTGQGYTLVNLAESALRLGEPGRAASALAEALGQQRDLKNPVIVADAFEAAAEVAVALTVLQPALAPRFLTVAAAVRSVARTVPTPAARRRRERATSAARLALGRRVFESAAIAGRGLTADEAIEAAIGFLIAVARSAPEEPAIEPPPPADHAVAPLTGRQQEVLRLLVDGLSDTEIAAALGLSRRTVETHVAAILNKLGLHARTAAVAYAVRHRLV
jgi:DNA-binding NarL/FixJ family response regulator